MNNKKTDFYGKFEFRGKMYPFYYEGSLVTVVQQPWEYNDDFEKVSYVEKIEGLTNSNKVIVFLKCEFQGGSFKEIYSNVIFSTKGFVLFGESDCSFNCIEFESDALNTFYPPIQLVDRKALLNEKVYKVKDYVDTTERFDTIVNEENIKMELSIPWKFSLRPEDKAIGEKYSVWRMEFETPKCSEDIAKYYLYLLDFLVFVNFRKNVAIEHFTLYKVEDTTYNKVGIGKFFSNQTGYDSKVENSIIFEDLTHDEISRLFSCISIQRKQDSYNDSYIPENAKKYRSFNWIDWLNTALSFEGEYCKRYKDLKSQSDSNFANAKEYLLTQIDNKIKESGVSIKNKRNSAWSKFKHLIEHTDTRLEEKFRFSLNQFSDEISVIKGQLLKKYKISEDVDLAIDYADYRNHLAHGDIVEMSDSNVVNFILMRVFIYCFILERADISKDVRKKAVEKLFCI
ncbi:MAG: hypothetical protein LUC95_05240 [Lachnospiraceae bacterium]|nr:hypothetical protein [Lachnospiraceae bacterium]